MQVAVWYMRMREPSVFIVDSEEEAAGFVHGVMDSGEAAVSGVQFEDGRLIREDGFEDWKAYLNVTAEADAREAIQAAPVEKREVIDPFSWSMERPRMAKIDAGLPEWVGKRA